MNRLLLLLLIRGATVGQGFAQRISFVRGKDVLAGDLAGRVFRKIATLGGKAAKADDLQLCPDGQSVVYTLSVDVKHPKGSGKPDFERYIEASRLDGSMCVRLPDEGERNSFGARWSPDAQSIVFDRLYRETPTGDLQWVVTVAGRDFKSSTRLLNPALTRGYFVYTWTPEGNLAVLGNDTLNVFSPDGQRREATPLLLDTLGGTSFSPSSADVLSISPDGRSMLWILTGADEGSKNFAALYDDEDLYGIMMIYERTTRVLRRISPRTIAMAFEPPVWSTDGKSVVFTGIQALKPLKSALIPQPICSSSGPMGQVW